MTVSPVPALRPRSIGLVNWLGLWTLIGKETKRFLKIYLQTIAAPVTATLMLLWVFSLGMGGGPRTVNGMPYLAFLAPGLIIMSIAQSAFINTSASLVLSKVQGSIVDVLMPPLSPLEFTLGYALGGVIRGFVVGLVSVIGVSFFAPMHVYSVFFILFYTVFGSMMLSLMGLMTGIWANKFDDMAAVQNFIILPATFLSGTFFSVADLPFGWRLACQINPFFYMIDGFRYGFIGVADSVLPIGMAFVFVVNLALLGAAYRMIDSGYKLKA